MLRTFSIGLSAIVCLGFLGGCGSAQGDGAELVPNAGEPQSTSSLVIDEQTETRTAGRVLTAAGTLSFETIDRGSDAFSVRIVVSGKTFDGSIDGERVVIDGHDVILSEIDRALLQIFADALSARFGDTVFRRDSTAYGFAVHLANAPQGYIHARIEAEPEPEIAALTGTTVDARAVDAPAVFGNEGKKCVKKGTSVKAAYTNQAKTKIVEAVVIGSNWGKLPNGSNYACMGKCGAACGMGGGYTKDCLDHDTCSFRYAASGGASDKNCGDEYSAASDDIFNSCSTK